MTEKEYKFCIELPLYAGVYEYCFEDLYSIDNIYIMKNYINIKTNFFKKIYKCHFTRKFYLPFRSLWNNKYYKTPFDKNDNIIFILPVPKNNIHKYGAIKKIRKKYPNCKIVLMLTDLVNKSILNRACKENELITFFSLYDYIVSFDYADCKKYGFLYNPLVYSAPKKLGYIKEDIDVYFCGRAKDRLDLIVNTYYFLKHNNVNCLFFLMDVPIDKRIQESGIVYLDDFMAYKDNLEYVKRSKCLLEIMQSEGTGYTLRTCEAVAYDKKIISNNLNLKNAEFYNDTMISFFDKAENIDLSFINDEKTEYNDRFYFSPNKLIELVLNIIKKEG